MARVTFSPLIAAVSGKTADAVFARWKGRAYIRARVIPANPKSDAQTAVRNSMAEVVALWQSISAELTEAYDLGSKQLQISGYNDMVARNRKHLQDADGLYGPRRNLEAAEPRITVPSDFVLEAEPAAGRKRFGWSDTGQGDDYRMGWLIYDLTNNVLFAEDLNVVAIENGNAGIDGCTIGDQYAIAGLVQRLSDGELIHMGTGVWTQLT